MVRQWQELFYDKRYACTCMDHAPDFVKLAEAFGAVGLRATRSDEVEKVLRKGQRPAFPPSIKTIKLKDLNRSFRQEQGSSNQAWTGFRVVE